jgi:hydroxypyruvate isomerase
LRDYIDIARHIQIAGAPGRHEPDIGGMDYRRLFKVIEELDYPGWIGCEYRPMGDTVAGLRWREKLLPSSRKIVDSRETI